MNVNLPLTQSISDNGVVCNPVSSQCGESERAFSHIAALLGAYRRFDPDRVRRYLAAHPDALVWVIHADAEELRSVGSIFSYGEGIRVNLDFVK
jgi:hypothetical protein